MKIFRSKENIILLVILAVGLFVRMYELPRLMSFIADQGWFYIQARDSLLSGSFPLVGIASSHPWLHQGAFWTYILMLSFKLSNFNPIVPSYIVAILGVITIGIVYKVGREMFSSKVGLLVAFLYATSPLVIADSRMAYHTSPIPLFTSLFIYFVFKWLNGQKNYFPLSILMLSTLYNFEIATFSLTITLFSILSFGVWKRKKWAISLYSKKIILSSILMGLIPMIPMIAYDTKHGFPQTIKFIVWIFYKIAVFFGFPPVSSSFSSETWSNFFIFTVNQIQKLIFYPNAYISIIVFITALGYLGFMSYLIHKKKVSSYSYLLLFFITTIPLLGYVAVKTPSAAYLPIIYPQLAIGVSVLFVDLFLKRKIFIFALGIVIITALSNTYIAYQEKFFVGPTFDQRIESAKSIIEMSGGKPYSILGKGEGSKYESFTMPHAYLTWYLGHGQSVKKEDLVFYVSEHPDRIKIERSK